jgi:hypothetical protein
MPSKLPSKPPTHQPTHQPTDQPTNPPGSSGPERRRSLLARWGRLLDGIRPATGADHLVRVAEVSRGTLPLAAGSLADLATAPVVRETRTPGGETRFTVLVAARDAEAAREALADL